MEFTIVITASHLYVVSFVVVIAVLLYIYMQDDSDDHLTHIRHDIEMKKEWFKMLDKRNRNAIR